MASTKAQSNDESSEIMMRRLFWSVFIFAEIWGVVAVVLAGLWMTSYGRFEWTADHVFNFHPLLLTVSMIFLHGQAILIYRVLRFLPKRLLKISHAIIHLSIMILFSIGLAAVFDFHNWKKIPNLYSLHSWLGLGMVVMFIGQYVYGALVYLLPYASLKLRAASMPFHRVVGILIFGGVGVTAMMGVTEKAIFGSKECWVNRTCKDADVINWFGISIFLYVASVLFLVAAPHYRRQPLPSD